MSETEQNPEPFQQDASDIAPAQPAVEKNDAGIQEDTIREQFHITDLLSVVSGRVVSVNHVSGLYNVLNYMTQSNVAARDRQRAAAACRQIILTTLPDLEAVAVDEITSENWGVWVAGQEQQFGALHPLPKLEHWQAENQETIKIERESMSDYTPLQPQEEAQKAKAYDQAANQLAPDDVARAAAIVASRNDLRLDENPEIYKAQDPANLTPMPEFKEIPDVPLPSAPPDAILPPTEPYTPPPQDFLQAAAQAPSEVLANTAPDDTAPNYDLVDDGLTLDQNFMDLSSLEVSPAPPPVPESALPVDPLVTVQPPTRELAEGAAPPVSQAPAEPEFDEDDLMLDDDFYQALENKKPPQVPDGGQ